VSDFQDLLADCGIFWCWHSGHLSENRKGW